jgi:L-ribulose-5-phosphate 4-epimerase
MVMNIEALCESCAEANRLLSLSGLVDLTFGNVSVFDPMSGLFAIKASGVAYEGIGPSHMVVLDLEGNCVHGTLRPSSDEPTHRRLYQLWGQRGVASVVHTHSRAAVAFAQAGQGIPCLGTTHADHFFGSVPITRYLEISEIEAGYEWETGNVIVEAFAGIDPTQCPAVLVRSHGPFAWGESSKKALENALALEIVADMALRTLAINPKVTAIPSRLLDKHFLRKHGSGAYYGQLRNPNT